MVKTSTLDDIKNTKGLATKKAQIEVPLYIYKKFKIISVELGIPLKDYLGGILIEKFHRERYIGNIE